MCDVHKIDLRTFAQKAKTKIEAMRGGGWLISDQALGCSELSPS
jgi:hypothetical protein